MMWHAPYRHIETGELLEFDNRGLPVHPLFDDDELRDMFTNYERQSAYILGWLKGAGYDVYTGEEEKEK